MQQSARECVVREGRTADVEAAARVLGTAFADYAWTRHTVAADGHHERLVASYAVVLEHLVLPHGSLWLAEDDRGAVVGAAGWLRPDSDPPPEALAEVGARVQQLRGDRAAPAAAAEELVGRHAATYPHWYLGTLGVHPDARGRGVGSALLRPALEAADSDGVPARLETSSRRNVALYERHGFRTTAEVAVPEGPRCWIMERRPRVP